MKKYLICSILGYVMVGSYLVGSTINAHKINRAEDQIPVMETEIRSGNLISVNLNDIVDFSTKGNQLFLYTSDGNVYGRKR